MWSRELDIASIKKKKGTMDLATGTGNSQRQHNSKHQSDFFWACLWVREQNLTAWQIKTLSCSGKDSNASKNDRQNRILEWKTVHVTFSQILNTLTKCLLPEITQICLAPVKLVSFASAGIWKQAKRPPPLGALYYVPLSIRYNEVPIFVPLNPA